MFDPPPRGTHITDYLFLAYFPKMKVGLSNHQSVCLSVCVINTN
jgi:hypothetical protein